MKIVVYPHTLELGGSQLNAIELAAAVRDRGHDVVVHAEPGELLGRIEDLGLRFVPCTRSGPRPHPGVAWDLLRLARRDGVDVLHGYEWPPILEVEAAAAAPGGPACTGTIMSMSVAPFLPDLNPLVVGTRRIRDHEVARGRRRVHVVEPPVDLATNHPGVTGGTWERAHPVPAGTLRVVIVSRLSEQLKLEGILSAIRAVGDLADSIDIRLQIAGDGPARAQVERAAAAANGRRAHPVVELLGNLPDPRGAYDAADVTIGMGGSALRAMSFATPVVVQGEEGFFELLTPATLPMFLEQGWYGRGASGPEDGSRRLAHILRELAVDPDRRDQLGRFALQVVTERFSLESAAATQESIYEEAVLGRPSTILATTAAMGPAVGLVRHKLRQRRARRAGAGSTDDFNARPV